MSIDVNKLVEEVETEASDERRAKAKLALTAAMRRRASAQQVLRNCDAEIEDLKASIEDGSFN